MKELVDHGQRLIYGADTPINPRTTKDVQTKDVGRNLSMNWDNYDLKVSQEEEKVNVGINEDAIETSVDYETHFHL